MSTHRKSLAIAGILAASLTLAACVPTESGAGGSSSSSTEGFNDQDVMFAQMMIPHHQQAVEMSDMILAKQGIDPQVTELAQTIKDEQEPEIQQMEGWLEDWDASAEMGEMDHSMSGMMSDEEMGNLDSASGDEASRLFLEQMIEHHNGAIEMAQTELDEGEYPEATELAQTIINAQQAEIDEMTEILSTL
ncbi:MAG: hypothetical protein RI885_1054 [Actinomycetota bacterium]|jgi:uncharacterized protein (DUF305 family)